MFLRTEEFLPYAPDDVGRKVRVNHESSDCTGGSNAMVVERKDDGVYAKCFRCGKYGRSIEGKPRHFFAKKAGAYVGRSSSSDDAMPRDSESDVKDWPSRARLWITQGGLTPLDSKTYGISYSPSLGRVVIPISYDGEYRGYLARKIFDEDQGPKYWIRSKDPSRMLFRVVNPNHSEVVVLCEDVLSAIRIGKHMTSFAILGTETSDFALKELTKGKRHGIIFLDYDNRIVIKKSRVLKNRLELLLDKVNLVNKSIDPKQLSDKDLYNILISYV